MKPSELNKAHNELFCSRILEKKDTLFAKHSNKLTQQDKNKVWEDIRVELINAGAVAYAGKSAKELSTKFSGLDIYVP